MLQKANPLPSFESQTCLPLVGCGQGCLGSDLYLVAETWTQLTFPYSSHFPCFLLITIQCPACWLTLGGRVFTQSLSVPSCPPDDAPTCSAHLPIFQRTKQLSQNLTVGCFIVLNASFTHPTPKWMQGLPGGTLVLGNPPASSRVHALTPGPWEDPGSV